MLKHSLESGNVEMFIVFHKMYIRDVLETEVFRSDVREKLNFC